MTHITSTRSTPVASKGWSIALWIVQIVLGGVFTMAGAMKLTSPISDLTASLPWTAVVPEFLTRFIGLSELLGGIGLIVPALTRIRPGLTVLAAAGLAIVMLLATIYHLVRGEIGGLGVTLPLAIASAFIAWGRGRKVPIQPRSASRSVVA